MALFKFRQGEDSSQAAPAQSVEAVRQRAKHRLIGAVVLVSLGVVGFPLLVDKQPRPMSVDLPIDIPDKTKTKPLTLPAPSSAAPAAAATAAVTPPIPPAASVAPAAADASSAKSAPAASSVVPPAASLSSQEAIEPKAPKSESKSEVKAEPKAEAKVEPKAEPKSEAKAEAKPAPKPADKPSADSGNRALALLEGKDPAKSDGKTATKTETRLVIQVGAYEDTKKVTEVRAKLERAGLKTYTQVVDTKEGKRTRVRLGPFATKAEADKAVDKIKKLDLPASILTL